MAYAGTYSKPKAFRVAPLQYHLQDTSMLSAVLSPFGKHYCLAKHWCWCIYPNNEVSVFIQTLVLVPWCWLFAAAILKHHY